MNFENIKLSEKHQRPHIVRFYLYEMSRIGNFIEAGSRVLVV
jgi:hypothetical protein